MANNLQFSVGDRVRFKKEYDNIRVLRGLPETLIIDEIRHGSLAFFEDQDTHGSLFFRLERADDGPW